MIAELFYPKELKEIIADLLLENNLRREPLEALEKDINVMTVIMILCVGIFLHSGGIFDAFFMVCLSLILMFVQVRLKTKRFKAYVLGERYKAQITSCAQNKWIKCKTIPDGKILFSWPLEYFVPIGANLKKGETIYMYHNAKENTHPMPDFFMAKRKFCLRKDLMGE